jgi:hypothetical protein
MPVLPIAKRQIQLPFWPHRALRMAVLSRKEKRKAVDFRQKTLYNKLRPVLKKTRYYFRRVRLDCFSVMPARYWNFIY